MPDRFDVAIAGAGPAGAQCARDVAKRGYDVVVLEAEPEADFPRQSNKSTGGTFPAMLGSFNVPDEVVMNFTEAVVLESPNDYWKRTQPGAVLDFAAFKRWLVRDGREHGATYWFDARVSRPVRDEDDEIVGVRYNGDEEVYADIVVDATGPAAALAKRVGVSALQREQQAVGIEWEMEGVELDVAGYADLTDAMMLRLDHDYAPGGYAWLFHTGGDRAKVGLCYIQNETYHAAAEDARIDDYLDAWQADDPRLENAERLEGRQHRGSAHVQPPGRMSAANFIAVGDTVPSIDPVWGEGIHKCLKSGRAAAVTADRCLTGAKDTSEGEMQVYDDLWHRDVAPRADVRLLMTHLLYYAPNDRYDRFIADMRRLSVDTLASANDGNPLALARLLHRNDLPLLVQFLRENWPVVENALPDALPLPRAD
ncbi:digeranylgeranylglycerophospholipid reductase [Halorubrum trueperi]|uniref:Digeranylgeranylglycerophospholipid reductase n=1 Tax=Halorubrum trueperi TaxID=2004704 RepID=A0ABD5UMP2_9EURY